jgi:hypothetical protein
MQWTMAQAKRDFARGVLASAEIKWFGLGMGYGLLLTSKLAGEGSGLLVDARGRKPRQFRTADAVIVTAREIGFMPWSLKIEGDERPAE